MRLRHRVARRSRLARRSSASSSTSSMRIRSSSAWLAACQSGLLTARVRSAWACSRSSGSSARVLHPPRPLDPLRSFPTPTRTCSPPPLGPGSTRPPDRCKRSGKDSERATWTRRWGCWLPVVSYSDGCTTACPVGRHGGSQHGKTTTDANHSNARQGAQEARWEGQGQPTGIRPAQGQEGPGSGIQGAHGQAESLR
jgi:hypothetical protein